MARDFVTEPSQVEPLRVSPAKAASVSRASEPGYWPDGSLKHRWRKKSWSVDTYTCDWCGNTRGVVTTGKACRATFRPDLAQGTAARSAETLGSAEGNGPVGSADAPCRLKSESLSKEI